MYEDLDKLVGFLLLIGLFTPFQPHTYAPPFWALSIMPILTAFLILSGNILLGVDKKLVSIGISEGMPRFSSFSNTLHNSEMILIFILN